MGASPMKFQLLTVEDCPNAALADHRARQAIALSGHRDIVVELTIVQSAEQAAQLGFRGSPTFLIDNSDPFLDPSEPDRQVSKVGLSCRLYHTGDGLQGCPTVAELAAALGHQSSGPLDTRSRGCKTDPGNLSWLHSHHPPRLPR